MVRSGGRQWWYTADWHLEHQDIIHYLDRPFRDTAEMGEEIVRRHNELVGVDDDVAVLGDVALCNRKDEPKEAQIARVRGLIGRMHGRKHLFIGNHDPKVLRGIGDLFETVQDYGEIVDQGRRIALFHYPLRSWNGVADGTLHLYGHEHGRVPGNRLSTDVGVDAWDFRPVRLQQVMLRMQMLPPRREVRPPPSEPWSSEGLLPPRGEHMRWYTADWRFGDLSALGAGRPFKNLTEMEEAIVRRHNARVRRGDDVWVLGGVARLQDAEDVVRVRRLIGRMNGRKHLIAGPGDADILRHLGDLFVEARAYAEISDLKRRIVLFPQPILAWNAVHHAGESGAIHFFARADGAIAGNSRSMEVGVDAWGFGPASLPEALARMAALPAYTFPDKGKPDLHGRPDVHTPADSETSLDPEAPPDDCDDLGASLRCC